MRVSLVVNTHRPDAIEAAQWAARWLLEHKADVCVEESLSGHFDPSIAVGAKPAEIANSDLVIAVGGDGTMIRAAHLCSEWGTAILGVYFGRFGFVTQCVPEDFPAALSAFIDGEHRVEKRMMIESKLIRQDRTVATIHTLNESVVQRTVTDRMLTFDVEVNDYLVTSYPADGVMVSTPTGSTGYSLSAGGPVVDPSVEALIFVALAPHTLSARPLVLSAASRVRLRLNDGGEAVLSGDGMTRLHMLPGDVVEIVRSPRTTNLVTIQSEDFLYKLRHRLIWSQSILG